MKHPAVAHRPELDGIRGAAILLVVGLHCFDFPAGGQLGVDLFFMLSGFLISTLLLGEFATRGRIRLRSFYRRRAARLLPALFSLLAIYVVVAAAKGVNGWSSALIGATYLANFARAFGYGHEMHGLGHLWSLAEEEQFYLVWPLLLPFVARRARPVQLLLLTLCVLVVYRAMLVLAGAGFERIYNGPDTHLDGLVVGTTMAFLLFRNPGFKLGSIWLLVAGPVLLELVLVRAPASHWGTFQMPIVDLALAVVVLGALTVPSITRAAAFGPLRFFGRISYSLYLWHYMLAWAWGMPHHAWAAAGIALIVAYASTRWVEEPMRARWRGHPQPELALVPA